MIPGSANPLLLGQTDSGYEIERSLRFNASDSSFLSRTPSAAGNRSTWTWSGWVKRSNFGAWKVLFSGAGSSNTDYLAFEPSDRLTFDLANTGNGRKLTTRKFRDPAAFYHIVLAVNYTSSTANDRIKLYINGVLEDTFDTNTAPAQNHSGNINNNTVQRISGVPTNIDYLDGYLADVHFIDGQALAPTDFGETDEFGVWQPKKFTGTYYADVTSATGALPIYNTTDGFGLVKGTGYRSDSFAGTTNGSGLVLAIPGDVATDVHHNINTGSSQATVANDGVAVITSNSRLYGSSLQFESANTDSLTVENSDMALGTGDLCVEFWVYNKTNKNYNAFISTRDSNGTSTGFVIAADSGGDIYVHSAAALAGNYSGDLTLPLNQWCHVAYTRASGTHRLFVNGVAASNSTTTSRNFTYNKLRIGDNPYATDEPVNAEIQDIRVYKGVAKYTSNFTVPARTSNGFHLDFADNSSNAALGTDTSGNGNTWTVNNLTAAAAGLATANQGFDVVTYTGNGGTQSISSLAFQPDFLWIKRRDTSYHHYLWDSIRGITKELHTDLDYAEGTATNKLASFNSDGFTIKNQDGVNANGSTYVAWTWKAAGAASSNTDGSVTSSVSANNTYGFSIVSFTDGGSACTVGHGLSSAPKMIWAKFRGAAGNWSVYHESIGNDHRLKLNLVDVKQSGNDWWNATSPTSSVFSLGSNLVANTTQIAYCWSEIPGFSKISSYAGSNSSQTIECGFEPAFVIIKCTTSGNDWIVQDNARGIEVLRPNLADAELGGNYVSFTSTGFTLNTSDGRSNSSGDTYIYVAFATKPDESVIDSLVDTPTNEETPTDTGAGGEVVGNYATLNPLDRKTTVSLSNGNLDATTSSTGWAGVKGTMGVSSGKYYFEATANGSAANKVFFGICASSVKPDTSGYLQDDTTERAKGMLIFCDNGLYQLDGNSRVSYSSSMADGDVISVAYDLDGNTVQFYKNGNALGSIDISSSPLASTTVVPLYIHYNTNTTYHLNFGQRAFAYAAPSGYKSLNTANLPEPTIADGSQYFDTKLFTGNGSTQSITMPNALMSPDFVWLKRRTPAAHHGLYDAVRGATKQLSSNLSDAESTQSQGLTSFDSNGFSLGNLAGENGTSEPIVSWNWDAGDSNTTIAAGSLNSSMYNQSQTWSNNYTGNFYGGYGAANAFNGILWNSNDDYYSSVNYPLTSSTTTFSPAITGTKIEVIYTKGGAGVFTINGTEELPATNTSPSTGQSAWSVYEITSSSISSITMSHDGGGSSYFNGVYVDGKLLVDSGVSVTNVPSVASTVRANPSAGFSIVSYTGTGSATSVAHGLNSPPDFIVCKDRDSSSGWWATYISSQGATKGSYLNAGNQAFANFTFWNDTTPTSSVFSIGANANTNASGNDFIAYCFSNVEGYCKIGQHTNGSSNNQAFIYTGFRPAWIIGRPITADWWTIYDSKRNPGNALTQKLWSNVADAEAPQDGFDFLSNGFKCIAPDNNFFASSANSTWIYMAFAEHPFKTSRAR